MAITYYMLQISSVLFFILIISAGAIFGGLFTYLFDKFIRVKVLRSHNEVTGFLFLSIASFYALLLSFIVLVVWDQLNETRGVVAKEGSSAVALYRDFKYYPDSTDSKELMVVYLDFVNNVIHEEFPNMAHMKLSRKTPESLNNLFYKLEHLRPKDPYQMQLVSGMFNHLNELATYRGLRTNSIEMEIPAYMWLPIILGAIITIFFSMLLDIEHIRMHVTLNAFLGVFIGMFLFVIILLDHPYTGSNRIKPKSYMQVFTLEKWDKELKSFK